MVGENLAADAWRMELDVIRAQVQGVIIAMFKPWLEATSADERRAALTGIDGQAIAAPIDRILDELEAWASHAANELTRRSSDGAGANGVPTWSLPRGWLRKRCAPAILGAGNSIAEYRRVASEMVSFLNRNGASGTSFPGHFRGSDPVTSRTSQAEVDAQAEALEKRLDHAWKRVTLQTEAVDRTLDVAMVQSWNEFRAKLKLSAERQRAPTSGPDPIHPRRSTLDLAIIKAGAPIREGPSTTSALMTTLRSESPVVVLDALVPGWLKVQLGGSAGEGWVETQWLRTQIPD